MYNIVVTFLAGSGSSYAVRYFGGPGGRDEIAKRGLCHMRADVMFDTKGISGPIVNSLEDKPVQEHKKLFDARVNKFYELDLNKSIEDNMLEYINALQAQSAVKSVLTGKLSILGPILTKNKITNVLGIIRHPMHNLAAAWVRRYPNMPERLFGSEGTVYSEQAIGLYVWI